MKLHYAWIFIPLVILLGVYYYYNSDGKAKDTPSDLGASLGINTADTKSMEIRRGEEVIRLTKTGDRWAITSPISSPADDKVVQELLDSVIGMKADRSLGTLAESGKAEYGLDEPEFRMDLFNEGGNILLNLGIGNINPAGTGRYVSAGAGELFLVESKELAFMDTEVMDVRSRIIIDLTPDSVTAFECSTNQVDYAFRRESDVWFLEKPETFRVTEGWCEDYLMIIQRARAEEFVDDVDSIELKDLTGGVRLIDKTGGVHGIKFLGENTLKGVLAESSNLPEAFLTEFRLETFLHKTLAELRESRLMLVLPENIGSVILREVGGDNLTLEKEADGHVVTKPAGAGPFAEGDFDAFFSAILAIAPEYYIEKPMVLSEIGLSPYWIKIEVHPSNGNVPENLYIGAKVSDGYYASSDDGENLFVISEDVLNRIIRATDKLRNAGAFAE